MTTLYENDHHKAAVEDDPLSGREFPDLPSLHQCFTGTCYDAWGCDGYCLRSIHAETGKTRRDIPWGEGE